MSSLTLSKKSLDKLEHQKKKRGWKIKMNFQSGGPSNRVKSVLWMLLVQPIRELVFFP